MLNVGMIERGESMCFIRALGVNHLDTFVLVCAFHLILLAMQALPSAPRPSSLHAHGPSLLFAPASRSSHMRLCQAARCALSKSEIQTARSVPPGRHPPSILCSKSNAWPPPRPLRRRLCVLSHPLPHTTHHLGKGEPRSRNDRRTAAGVRIGTKVHRGTPLVLALLIDRIVSSLGRLGFNR